MKKRSPQLLRVLHKDSTVKGEVMIFFFYKLEGGKARCQKNQGPTESSLISNK